MRRFWRGDEGIVPELAARLLGSADLFERAGRRPQASLNFVTSHDGFTLPTSAAMTRRHNEANGEGNRDGHGDNHGLNHGVEGAERRSRRAARCATAIAAQPAGHAAAVPGHADAADGRRARPHPAGQQQRLLPGQPDQLVRLGQGEAEDAAFLAFARRLIALRQAYLVLRQTRFLHGRQRTADGIRDVVWLAHNGLEMTESHWHDKRNRCFGLKLGD